MYDLPRNVERSGSVLIPGCKPSCRISWRRIQGQIGSERRGPFLNVNCPKNLKMRCSRPSAIVNMDSLRFCQHRDRNFTETGKGPP